MRLPRTVVPGVPLHVTQRGNNRAPTFFVDEDRELYLQTLSEASERYGCAVHAYVLMTNHVHLLLTPAEKDAVSRLLQAVGRVYVRYVNDRHRRTGTLWEGRYRSSLVRSDRYLLVCHAYIELNPVRAGMVSEAGRYRWSSHRHNAGGAPDPVVTPHPLYNSLGSTDDERRAAYRALLRKNEDPDELATVRELTIRGGVLADPPMGPPRHGGNRKRGQSC